LLSGDHEPLRDALQGALSHLRTTDWSYRIGINESGLKAMLIALLLPHLRTGQTWLRSEHALPRGSPGARAARASNQFCDLVLQSAQGNVAVLEIKYKSPVFTTELTPSQRDRLGRFELQDLNDALKHEEAKSFMHLQIRDFLDTYVTTLLSLSLPPPLILPTGS
jgi:hypothetical protein